MDRAFLEGFIYRADRARLRMRGICIYHNEEKIAEYNWLFNERRNIHSISKSFTSMAVGKAIEAGYFSMDDKIAKFFEDKLPDRPDSRLLDIRVEDLLTMRVGFKEAMNAQFRTCVIEDVAKYYLARPMSNSPGTVFDYDTGASYMLSALLQRSLGMSLRDYLQKELFSPLGIENVTWPTCPQGVTVGGSGLMLSVEEMARAGQLMLQNGEWKGRQIVPAHYLELATKTHTKTPEEFTGLYGSGEGRFKNAEVEIPKVPAARAGRGYGYQFWTEIYPQEYPRTYYCSGSWGKWIIVCPEKNAAVSLCAHEQTNHGQMIIEQLLKEEVLDKL